MASPGFWDRIGPGNLALAPFSGLYALGWLAYEGLYALGIKGPAEPMRPVICVGNRSVGGSGKTPFVRTVVRLLREMGRDPVVSCSGYGSPASDAARWAPEGPLDATQWGDEPALLRWRMPDLPLIVGRRRVLAAKLCAERSGSVLVLDDGFQHLPLRKHVSILIDPQRANGFCLPAGPYREPRSGRRRADLVLPGALRLEASAPVFLTPEGALGNAVQGKVDVLCAIGQPAKFLTMLTAAGVEPAEVRILPDHDPLNAGNLLAGLGEGRPLVVTAKDWVKLRSRHDLGLREVAIVDYDLTAEPEDEFREWLRARLEPSTA